MCGIYGLFQLNKAGLLESDIDTLKAMAIVTSLRGDHSSGIAVLGNKPKTKPWTAKAVGDPFNLFHNAGVLKQLKQAFTGSNSSVGVFGHGRLATRGDITIRNAHPFTEGNITLVHNGTLVGVDMDQTCEKGEKVEVDSHILAIEMDKLGVAEALRQTWGAYAIIAHDKKEGKVHFATNGERPLFYINYPQTKLWVMSEQLALFYVALKKGSNVSLKAQDVHPFEKEFLYTLDLNTFTFTKGESLAKAVTQTPFRTATRTGGVGSETIFECRGLRKDKDNPIMWLYDLVDDDDNVYTATSSLHQPERKGQYAQVTRYRIERSNGVERRTVKFKDIDWYEEPAKPDTEEPADAANQDSIETVKTVNEKYISVEDWNKARQDGCQVCQGPIYKNEPGVSYLMSDGKLVCGQCVSSGRAKQMGLLGVH